MLQRDDTKSTLTVHIIPHSHMDVGWAKSVDEYFTGFDGRTSHAKVEQILEEVIFSLLMDSSRRFCIAEMKFFSMWW
jgi:hypothetical protein